MIYEIASANRAVYWVSLQRKVGELTTQVPILPFEDHRMQMRALCELVTAKTGLPLYDLSKGQDGEGERFRNGQWGEGTL
jgi:hypothetical protein